MTTAYVYTLLAGDGTALYIGCTDSLGRRLGQHQYTKSWWSEVVRVESDVYPSLEAGREVEAQRIREAQPTHNTYFTSKAFFANGWAKRRAHLVSDGQGRFHCFAPECTCGRPKVTAALEPTS